MWQKLDRIMAGIGTVLSVISVGVVVILGILQVLFRFVLKISVPWTEEMMRALYIYIVFFGLILVERENGEVRTTMVIEKLPKKAYHVWETIVALLSILFNILVIVGCFQAIRVTNTTLSALPQISMKMFFYPMVISMPLMVIYQIYHMIGHIRKLSGKPGEEAEA